MSGPDSARIAIIGAGIGGLAAALALKQQGVAAQVYERAEALTEIGAGIQISPNGAAVLRALGVGDRLQALSVQARAVRLIDAITDRPVARLPLEGQDYHFLHRADLIGLLADAAREAGIQVTLGAEVRHVSSHPRNSAQVPPGAELFIGNMRHDHDWIIGADGLHSVARSWINPGLEPEFSGQVAWRATIPADHAEPPEVRVYLGPGRHLVRYPLRGGALINLVAVEERDAWAAEGWHHETAPDPLQQAFAGFPDAVQADLARVTRAHLWGLHRHAVAPDWHRGGVILMGDAAHPTLPFLAQGANMALEDAWVLARCLSDGSGPARYQALRRARTVRITEAAQKNARNYHLHPGPARTAAHAALRLVSATAPGLLTRRFDWLYNHDVTRG